MSINAQILRETRLAMEPVPSQETVAGHVGMTSNAYAILERGERDFIRSDTLARLANFYGLSADEILGISPKRRRRKRASAAAAAAT